MNSGFLICLLLAHVIADFLLQFKKVLKLRYGANLKQCLLGNVYHAIIYFIVSMISVVYYWSGNVLLIVAAISVLHGLIDFAKSLAILKKPYLKYSWKFFLFDQVLHLLCIYSVIQKTDVNPADPNFFATRIEKLINDFKYLITGVTYNQKLLLSIIFVIIGLWGVGVFIRIVLDGMTPKKQYSGVINLEQELLASSKSSGAVDGGFIIGMLERAFIIISIVLNMESVIGFILAAKSIARLKKFDDDCFVEIFIIGSFISFISAIAIGYAIKFLKVLPIE